MARRPGMLRVGAAVSALLAAAILTGCGPTVTAPDVVGMRLDAAHREFEALGVEEFEDTDIIGEEDWILRDANWVVVEQDPKPGTEDVDTDTTIKLSVGNEDDSTVLEMIPEDSPFAVEMAKKEEEERAEEEAEAEQEAQKQAQEESEEPSTAQTPAPDPEVARCVRRKGNPGEIYVWNAYGSDQQPDAMRLGGGYVWDFGNRVCITTTESALNTVAPLSGYCTEVGKVASNPGYRVNMRPAPRIPNIIGQAGDC